MNDFITDGVREDPNNAQDWDEPSDLHHEESLSVYLTRESWHVKNVGGRYEWVARNADGEVDSGGTDTLDGARRLAREFAIG